MTGMDSQLTDDALLRNLHQLRTYAILQLDGVGRVHRCNAGVEALFGYVAEELAGRPFSCLFTESDREQGTDQRALSRALAGHFEPTTLAMVRKDGSRLRASLVLESVASEGDTSMLMIVRDITDFFQAEIRVREARESAQRVQQLDAVNKLNLGLSHDFNNLLSVIGNSLEMLAARRAGDEAARRIVDIALRAVARGTQLTRQMLALGGAQVQAPEVREVSGLLHASQDLYGRVCGRGIALEIRADADLLPVTVDVGQFEAALLNMLSNSRDAMNGVGRIVVEAKTGVMALPATEGRERPFVCITVGDSGPGIGGDIKQKVFEPFFTTKTAGDGNGLGLSQVHDFAAQSGGGASIGTSVLGGAAVSIYLPAVV